MSTIYFYAPDPIRQKNIQQDHTQWTGFHSNFTAWIAQTYFYLKQTGLKCEIAHKIPEKGILIADRDTLDNDYPFLDEVMLICVQSDKEYHPSAYLHVVYNPDTWEKSKNSIWNPHLIGHWPMPGLIPRDKKRQSLVKNISYIGTRSQLAAELKSKAWQESLADCDCSWQPIWERSQWHDYTNLDAIVAGRSFDSKNYPNKGSIKLINAWHAGVPAILTPELGFMAERRTELDFLIVRSCQEALQAIQKLKKEPQLYQKIVENGLERAKEYSIETVLTQWVNFFDNVAFPIYKQYSNMSKLQKKILFTKRFVEFKYSRMKHKINRFLTDNFS